MANQSIIFCVEFRASILSSMILPLDILVPFNQDTNDLRLRYVDHDGHLGGGPETYEVLPPRSKESSKQLNQRGEFNDENSR